MRRQIEMQTAVVRVLTTPVGSRVMRPLFGSRLFELIDRTIDDSYHIDAIHSVYEAIESNLPELEVREVTVKEGVLHLRISDGKTEEGVDVRFAA